MAKKVDEKILERYIVFFLYPEDDDIFGVNLGFNDLLTAQESLNQADKRGGIFDRVENRIIQLKEQ